MKRESNLVTPGNGAIELVDINNTQYEDSPSLEAVGRKHSVSDIYLAVESSEASLEVYEKPHTTPMEYVTPMDGTAGRGHDGESSLEIEKPTPGELVDGWMDDLEFSDLERDIDKIQKSDIGDCHFCWKHKRCCGFLSIFLLLLLLACLILIPRPLNLCVTFSFDDENAIDKIPGDEGLFDLKIANPNYIPVSIHGFEINAYYGDVAEEKEVINVARSDFSIGAKNTLETNNKTYVYAENSTVAVPIAAVHSCSMGARADLTYNLIASFKACLSFVCKSGIVLETSYVNNCLRKDEWMCTGFKILG